MIEHIFHLLTKTLFCTSVKKFIAHKILGVWVPQQSGPEAVMGWGGVG